MTDDKDSASELIVVPQKIEKVDGECRIPLRIGTLTVNNLS